MLRVTGSSTASQQFITNTAPLDTDSAGHAYPAISLSNYAVMTAISSLQENKINMVGPVTQSGGNIIINLATSDAGADYGDGNYYADVAIGLQPKATAGSNLFVKNMLQVTGSSTASQMFITNIAPLDTDSTGHAYPTINLSSYAVIVSLNSLQENKINMVGPVTQSGGNIIINLATSDAGGSYPDGNYYADLTIGLQSKAVIGSNLFIKNMLQVTGSSTASQQFITNTAPLDTDSTGHAYLPISLSSYSPIVIINSLQENKINQVGPVTQSGGNIIINLSTSDAGADYGNGNYYADVAIGLESH